jgi:hypothetical protein
MWSDPSPQQVLPSRPRWLLRGREAKRPFQRRREPRRESCHRRSCRGNCKRLEEGRFGERPEGRHERTETYTTFHPLSCVTTSPHARHRCRTGTAVTSVSPSCSFKSSRSVELFVEVGKMSVSAHLLKSNEAERGRKRRTLDCPASTSFPAPPSGSR